MFDKIHVHNWISLSKETRKHLSEVFALVPTGIAEIRDQQVISDGYSNADLEKITHAKMAEYVGSNESFSRLWELTIAKVKYELNPPIVLDLSNQSEEEQKAIVETLTENGAKLEPVQEPIKPVDPNRFCDTCESKGIKHQKICPKAANYK